MNGTVYDVPVTDPTTGITLTTVSFTGGASDTASAAALVTAWNRDPIARGRATPSSALGVVSLEALWAGVDFGIGTLAGVLTAATVLSGASAARVPFGRFVVASGPNTASGISYDHAQTDNVPTGGLPYAALLLKGKVVATITYESGVKVVGRVRFPVLRESYEIGPVTMASNLATSAAAVVSAFNAALPANRVVVTNTAGEITFETEIPLLGFEVDLWLEGATTATLTYGERSGMSYTPETFGLGFAIARRADAQPASLDVDDLAYEPGEVMEIDARGPLWLDKPSGMTQIAPGALVWIGMDSGNEGKLYHAASGANRFPLPANMARFVRFGVADPAIVEVYFENPAA